VKNNELRICGLAAVRARFKRNPASIVRLYFDEATSPRIGILCRALAAAHRIYRKVEVSELEKIAATVHHGGIVAIVTQEPPRAADSADAAAWFRRGESMVVLDRVGNPHNLGAIVRTAAYFGVSRLILSGDPASAGPSDAAYRVAEGGMEYMEIQTAQNLPAFLRALGAAGFDVVGAATRGGAALPSPRAGRGGSGTGQSSRPGPWALVLGNEERGLDSATLGSCTRRVTIQGSGRVESLNVSVAASILIHSLAQGQRSR
jgi:TrmH RNA methyltransferase